MITTDVENFPGFESAIQGPWLMDQMQKQALAVGTELNMTEFKQWIFKIFLLK